MYRPLSEEEFTSDWEPLPDPPVSEPVLPILDLKRLGVIGGKTLKPDSPWEAGVFHVPNPVSEGGRPYYPRLAIVCQQSSGFLFHSEMGGPENVREQLLADAICQSVTNHGFLPEVIYVNDRNQVDALSALGKALKTSIQFREELSAIPAAQRELTQYFLSQRGGG